MTETDFLAAVRANVRPPGLPCSVGSLIVRLRADNPTLAAGMEAAMSDLSIPASAIESTLEKFGLEQVPASRINHHRNKRCRHCPARA